METSGEMVDQGSSEQSDDGFVSLEEASDADLDAFIQEDRSAETDTLESRPNEVNAPDEEYAEGVEEYAEESPRGETKEEASTRIAQLEAQLAQTQKYVKQRGNEIGELRKQARDLILEKEALARELENDNPREAARLDRVIEVEKVKEYKLQQEEERLSRVEQAYDIVPRYINADEMDVGAIRQELLDDNLPQDWIDNTFIPNMFELAPPETIVHLAKRAIYGKAIKYLVPALQERDARIAQLEAQVRGKGENLLNGLKRAASTPPPLTTSSSVSDNSNRSPSIDPSKMSDAELDEFLKRNG